MTRPTKRQKFLATAIYPTCQTGATWDEVRKAKLACRGHYWNDTDFDEFAAFTSKGKRKYFSYDDVDKADMRYCAKLWTQDKTKEAEYYESSSWAKHIICYYIYPDFFNGKKGYMNWISSLER